MTICCVKGCGKEQYPGCGLHFHRIPWNPELKEKWLKVIPLAGKLSKNSTVCSSHFKSDDYVSASSCDQKYRCLKEGVVPSIFTDVKESNQPDSEEECDDEMIDNVTGENQDEARNVMVATHNLTENKRSNVLVVTPRAQESKIKKIMVLTPISTVNKIENIITIKSNVNNKHIQSSSTVKTVGTSTISQVDDSLNNSTQIRANNVIVVKPITEIERIQEIISTKNISNSNDSDEISSVNESSVSDMSSDDETSMVVPVSEEIYIRDATPERTLKRKYLEGSQMDTNGSKIPRNSNLDATNTNIIQNSCEKPIKHHASTQTGRFTTQKEQELKKKIKALKQKIRRRETAFNQMKTILDLIKHKCRNYAEVKEVLSLKLKQLPDNLNCDEIIMAP